MAFEMAFETLTTNEAAFVAGVSVDDVNRVIDRKILPESLYETSPVRTLKRGACVFIAFWFETCESLTPKARQRIISSAVSRGIPWTKLRACKLQESRTIEVGIQTFWDEVNDRLLELRSAQQMVVKDPEILSGAAIIQGTRIPVYDVASLVEAKTPMGELRELYPVLSEKQLRLAAVYAKARPLRGRPKQRSLLDLSRISVSKRHLQEISTNGNL
jgi:uncharacterized protein (DUF433 family)